MVSLSVIVRTIIQPLLRRFCGDQRGQIAIIFGLSVTMIVIGVGAGIDLARAYVARQKLSQVAELTCQFSTQRSVIVIANPTNTAGSMQLYLTAVNTFATKALSGQKWGTTVVTDPSNGANYFSATAPSGDFSTATGTTPTNPVVELKANLPTTFMQIIKVPQIAVHAKIACLTGPYVPSNYTASNQPLQYGFETSCTSYCFTKPDGTSGTSSTPTSTTPSNPSFTSSSGQGWYIIGYCLETDITGVINSTSPERTHTGELDCDNGSGSAGNSSITAKVYLAAGSYELRYNYRSRVDYPNYDPTYICATTAADVAWANDMSGGSLRTNQINAYLDLATSANIPLHSTMDGQQLGGSNLIDVCVYSLTWVERSVKIQISKPAYYWLSFAADGTNDSYGGQLDNIRICQQTCTTTLQDNFPTAWLAANNGGVNKVLFEDSFESWIYPQDSGTSIPHSKSGNLVNSTGTTATSPCGGTTHTFQPGWPCQSATASSPSWASGYTQGWGTAPVNEVVMNIQGAYQGAQYPALVGNNGFSSGTPSRNRAISRPFILDPGYYQIDYDYISGVDFSPSNIYGTFCSNAPSSGYIFASSYGNQNGTIRFGTTTSADPTTNIVGVFMSNGQLVSTPINSGATLGSTTQFTNPDGTITTNASVPPDTVNWQSYDATAVNPVLDVCGYADSFRWLQRSVAVKITKPGVYWLTFSANGDLSSNGNGGGIDDVKITALGSPFMTTPPTTSIVAIPVPAPQPGSLYYGLNSVYNGYTITADPFMPPAAN